MEFIASITKTNAGPSSPRTKKAGKGKKGKTKMKKGDNVENMDVVVAQQAIDDASSPDICDVLMGSYETE